MIPGAHWKPRAIEWNKNDEMTQLSILVFLSTYRKKSLLDISQLLNLLKGIKMKKYLLQMKLKWYIAANLISFTLRHEEIRFRLKFYRITCNILMYGKDENNISLLPYSVISHVDFKHFKTTFIHIEICNMIFE